MAYHHQFSTDVKVGDTVFVRWGRFGMINARVASVLSDGSIRAIRWNKKQQRWTTAKRYYVSSDRKRWIEHNVAE